MSAEQTAGRRRPTRAQTRRRLLDAAAAVFAERGIGGTSINDISAAAGLTKGAFYSSFAGKDELVLALMEEHLVARVDAATAAFAELGDVGEAAHEAGARLLLAVHQDATWHRLFLEYWGAAMRDPEVHAGLAERRAQLRRAMTEAIQRAADVRRLTLPLPAEELAVAMLALSNGFAIERGIDPDAVPERLFGTVLARLIGDA
ncbi:TetR/AcrR family transcriptional regulator [Amycolatopsis nigrescens]|uniref:TetR/AcrR family transcriptional regulator n=1 Tax=Amycolatopsis nigrescens TaxID=381445 RepID=UPI000366CBFA|nr:TetR/AcrR family transcriptional regulator [Amycolatopsis nigrescens]